MPYITHMNSPYAVNSSRLIAHVRYWKGLNDKRSLTAALEEVRAAWLACQQPEVARVSSAYPPEHSIHESAATVSSEPIHGSGQSSIPSRGGNVGHEIDPRATDGEDIGQDTPQRLEKPGDLCPRTDAPIVTAEAHIGHPESGKYSGSQSEKVGTTGGDVRTRISSLPPEIDGSRATISDEKRRGSPILLEVLGFAAEWDSSLRQGCVALIGEWPGIGSLQDLLEGRTAIRRASQEDLIRWTRQVAEGLMRVCGSAGAGSLLRLSTRNVYLLPRTKTEFSLGSAEVLDARVR